MEVLWNGQCEVEMILTPKPYKSDLNFKLLTWWMTPILYVLLPKDSILKSYQNMVFWIFVYHLLLFFFFFVVREFYPICHQLMPHLRKWSFTLLINHTDITTELDFVLKGHNTIIIQLHKCHLRLVTSLISPIYYLQWWFSSFSSSSPMYKL